MHSFQLRWWKDGAGYELEHEDERIVVRARGGLPSGYYAPMDIEGLWRRFADQCLSEYDTGGSVLLYAPNRAGILDFVHEFGLLAAKPPLPLLDRPSMRQVPVPADSELLDEIANTAALIREIADQHDKSHQAVRRDERDRHRQAAIDLFNSADSYATVTPHIQGPNDRGGFEFALVPLDLHAALLLQAGQTLAGDFQLRRCRRDRCGKWFRVGGRDQEKRLITKRREYCSPKCQLADAARRRRAREVQS